MISCCFVWFRGLILYLLQKSAGQSKSGVSSPHAALYTHTLLEGMRDVAQHPVESNSIPAALFVNPNNFAIFKLAGRTLAPLSI
jgi:hypothetical protein